MKKVIVFLFFITIIIILTKEKDINVLIPDNAIRFRIVANSNNIEDQVKKMNIKNDLEPILAQITNNNLEESIDNIKNSIPSIKSIVKNYTDNYDVSFGKNYFPEKIYKNVHYPAGNYESLVITLGDGLGENWWCVLFPPLCLIEAKDNNTDDISYSFYIKEIIDKYK